MTHQYQDKAEGAPSRDRDAVLQPPKPEMRPAPQLERHAVREAEAEAGI
jgi:hypothetical protein